MRRKITEKECHGQNKKRIVLITRAYNNKKIKKFVERIHKELFRIIVLVNCEKETDHYTQTLLSKCKNDIFDKLEIIHVKPWGVASGALNIGLMKAFNNKEKPVQILIASPEIKLLEKHVVRMSEILSEKNKMLVVGYALKANLKKLKNLEKGHSYKKSASDALRVPWNTCAMWSADLFLRYVGIFHIICDCSKYLGKDQGIKLHGMEDALAIALAVKNNPKLEIGLIKKPLEWEINKENINKHKEKMKRKKLVYKNYKKIFGAFPSLDIKYF